MVGHIDVRGKTKTVRATIDAEVHDWLVAGATKLQLSLSAVVSMYLTNEYLRERLAEAEEEGYRRAKLEEGKS